MRIASLNLPVSIALREGHTIGLVGESGSGKTTLGLALLRLERSEGGIRFDGRELQGLSQTQLSALCGIPQTTISSIENGRVNLGVERAKTLALALRCPAVVARSAAQVRFC